MLYLRMTFLLELHDNLIEVFKPFCIIISFPLTFEEPFPRRSTFHSLIFPCRENTKIEEAAVINPEGPVEFCKSRVPVERVQRPSVSRFRKIRPMAWTWLNNVARSSDTGLRNFK